MTTPLRQIVVARTADGGVFVTSAEPRVNFWPADEEPPTREVFRASEEIRQRSEIRALVASAGAAPRPTIVHACDADGGRRAFVSWPECGDRALAALVAAASVPIEYDLESGKADPEVEAELVAAAAQSERRQRRELLEERRRHAESHFAKIEQEAIARSQARRRQHEDLAVFKGYVRARWAAALRRRAAKENRR